MEKRNFFNCENIKIKDQVAELENEIRTLNGHIKSIIKRGIMLIHKLNNTTSFETYLMEYSSVTNYFSMCSTLVTEFRTKLEILLLDEMMLNITSSVTSDVSPAKSAIKGTEDEAQLNLFKNGIQLENSNGGILCSTEESGSEITEKDYVNISAINDGRVALVNEGTTHDSTEKDVCIPEVVKCETYFENDGFSEQLPLENCLFPDSDIRSICDFEGNINIKQNHSGKYNQFVTESLSYSTGSVSSIYRDGSEDSDCDLNAICKNNSTVINSNNYHHFEKSSVSDRILEPVALPNKVYNLQSHIKTFPALDGSLQSYENSSSNVFPYVNHPFLHDNLHSYTLEVDPSCNKSNQVNLGNFHPYSFQYSNPKGQFCTSEYVVKNNEGEIDEQRSETQTAKKSLTKFTRGCSSVDIDDDIKYFNFGKEVGRRYHVTLGSLISPSEFYVIVQCEGSAPMNDMKLKIKDQYQNNRKKVEFGDGTCSHYHKKKLASMMLGSYAVGYVTEHSDWVRVKILDWRFNEDEDTIHVFCIDNGSFADISLDSLQPMDSILRRYPQFSQKCHLSGIRPVGKKTAHGWSEDVNAVFQMVIEHAKNLSDLEIEITEHVAYCGDNSLGVRLKFSDNGICININEKLIEYGVADEASSVGGEKNESGTVSDDRLRLSDDLDKTQGELSIQWSDHVASLSSSALPVRKSKNSYASDINCRYMAPFKTGETVNVNVTCVVRFNKFYCVKDYERTNEPDILQAILTFLNSKETESAMVELREPPEIGQLVIAKFVDDLWYRAKVLKWKQKSNVCKVLFLDYGNTDKVHLKNMRRMESEYLKYPFQMIECRLEATTLATGTDASSVVNYFCGIADEEQLVIKIIHILNRFQAVYSVSVYNTDGVDMEEVMVSNGHAEWLY